MLTAPHRHRAELPIGHGLCQLRRDIRNIDQIVKGTASHVRHVGIPELNQRPVGMPVDNTDGVRRVLFAVFHYLLIWTHDIHPLVQAMCILVCIFLP